MAQAVETGTGLFGGAWPSVTMVQPDELEIAVEAQADQNVHRAAERLAASGLHVDPSSFAGGRRPSSWTMPAACRPTWWSWAAAATARSSR